MKSLTANLPDKLSDIILIALEDLRKAERSKKYKVNMNIEHRPNGVCQVCLYGSIMAQCDGVDETMTVGLDDFSNRECYIFDALDWLRQYDFETMLGLFVGDRPLNRKEAKALVALEEHFNIKEWSIGRGKDADHLPSYDWDAVAFKHNMETVAAILQEHRL